MRQKTYWVAAMGVAAAMAGVAQIHAQHATANPNAQHATVQPATVNTTVVLKSGERHSGQSLGFRWDKGQVTMRTSMANEPRWGVGDVAYVDFGGTADPNLTLSGSEQAVVLRDGRVIKGQVLELGADQHSGDFLVVIKDQGNQEQRFQAGQVARVYFSNPTAPPAAAPATGTTGVTPSNTLGGGIAVSARQQWTSTGLVVRRGEVLEFRTTGDVQLSGDSADAAGSAGSKAAKMAAANAPVPGVLAGALIARVGNGRPFPIGDQTSVTMPDGGQLFLGVNDDHVDDNAGEFRVEIRRSGRRR